MADLLVVCGKGRRIILRTAKIWEAMSGTWFRHLRDMRNKFPQTATCINSLGTETPGKEFKTHKRLKFLPDYRA